MSDLNVGTFTKAAAASRDFPISWAPYLKPGETIVSATYSVSPSGLTVGAGAYAPTIDDDGKGVVVWLQGGSPGVSYEVTCHATTSNTPPRIDDRTITVTIPGPLGADPFPPNSFNVLNYGADPNGVEDSTLAFQQAIDAAEPGGLVYVPAGKYRIDLTTTITVKPGVTVTGPERGMKQGNQIFPGTLDKDGANLHVYGTGRLFTHNQQSHVANLGIYYPNQQTNAAPDVYDYAFYMGTNQHGCSIRNITAINPYRFAYVNIGGVLIENVIAGPLSRGITLGRVADVARIHNVQFNCNINQNNGATLVAWVQANLTAFLVDGAEEFNFTDCFAVICNIGLGFNDEDADNFPSYGGWKGGGIDFANACVIVLDGMALSTLRMSNCSMIPTATGDAIKMQDSEASPTHKPTVFLEGFDIHGAHSRAFWLDSNSNGRIAAARGTITGTVNQIALAQKSTDGMAGGVIEIDRVGVTSTISRPATDPANAGAGNVSDCNGFALDNGAFLQSSNERGGAFLADADAAITIAGGAWRVLPPGTLSANRTVDIDNGAEGDDECIVVDRQDEENFTLTIRDNANVTIAVFPVLTKMRGKFRKAAGANFVREELIRLT